MPYATIIKRVVASSGEGLENIVLGDPHAIASNTNNKPWINDPQKDQTMFVILKILPEEEREINGDTFDIYMKFMSENNNPINIPSKILVSTAAHKLNNFVILASQRVTSGLICGPYFAVSMRLGIKSVKKYIMITLRADPQVSKIGILLLSVHARTSRQGLSNVMLSQVNKNCKNDLSIRNIDADPGLGPEASSSLINKSVKQQNEKNTKYSSLLTSKVACSPDIDENKEEKKEKKVEKEREKEGKREQTNEYETGKSNVTNKEVASTKPEAQSNVYVVPKVYQPLIFPVKVLVLNGHKLKEKEVSFDGNCLAAVQKGCRSVKKNSLWSVNERVLNNGKRVINKLRVCYGIDVITGTRNNKILTLIAFYEGQSTYNLIGIAFKNSLDCRKIASALMLTQGLRIPPGLLLLRRTYQDMCAGISTKIVSSLNPRPSNLVKK